MSNSDFRIVGPQVITDAVLSASTIPETTVPVWLIGSTYALGAQAGVVAPKNGQTVYQSLQAANTSHDPATSPDWWQALGVVYGTYASGTAYSLGDIVTVIGANSHLLYESQANANAGNPVTDGVHWLPTGNTNRWAMFDKAVQTQTVSPVAFTQTFTPATTVNTVVALNIQGASVTVAQAASGYSRTIATATHNVLSWYDYWYQDLAYKTDVAFDDIPPYTGPITVTVQPTAGAAALGVLVLGKYQVIGTTAWEFTGGVLSYSTTTETKGVISMVKRPSAKKLNFRVNVDAGYADEAYRILTKWTDTEIVIIGTIDYSMAIAYGYLGQWEVPVSAQAATTSIEFRGLT